LVWGSVLIEIQKVIVLVEISLVFIKIMPHEVQVWSYLWQVEGHYNYTLRRWNAYLFWRRQVFDQDPTIEKLR
jgi:hypothetical protein